MKSVYKPDVTSRVACDLQIFMAGYASTGFGADGMDAETGDEVVLGGKVGWNKGHPKFHV